MKYKLLFVLVSVLLLATLCYTATIQYRQTNEFTDARNVKRGIIGVVGDQFVIQAFDKDGKPTLEIITFPNGDSTITQTNTRTGNLTQLTNDGNGPSLLIQEQRKTVRYTVRGTEILPEL